MERIAYFDLETKYSADEVGGWSNIEDMGMSVGVIWDSVDQDYAVYLDHQVPALIEHCRRADLVVGFNHIGFDYRVLAGARHPDHQQRQQLYTELLGLSNLDMLVELKKELGHRLKLESVARPTLGVGKSADGLQSLEWYKEGKIDKIIEYCKMDVQVTRDVYLYAQEHGHLHYDSRSGIKMVQVRWQAEAKRPEAQQMSLF
ncbi:MAG: ribonuclease H-like domain-containing protein [bacterium]|jgi:DEAD/DEAH box helicase domain-containing protein